ncbi:MAG: hypothetical protein IIA67_04255 [Planctomycetes bacterium]|nr:hypothetical protein [Planctomycetota bacterium]
MSVGPMGGILGSAAGAPLAQTKGSDKEKAIQEAAAQKRRSESAQKASEAAGVGQTEENQASSERDADGRRLWEAPPGGDDEQQAASVESPGEPKPPGEHPTKDVHGQAGNQLDLSG